MAVLNDLFDTSKTIGKGNLFGFYFIVFSMNIVCTDLSNYLHSHKVTSVFEGDPDVVQ